MKTLNKILCTVLILFFALNNVKSMGVEELVATTTGSLNRRVISSLNHHGIRTDEDLKKFINNRSENTSEFERLIQIRGIGPISARQIISALNYRADISQNLTSEDRRNALNAGRDIDFSEEIGINLENSDEQEEIVEQSEGIIQLEKSIDELSNLADELQQLENEENAVEAEMVFDDQSRFKRVMAHLNLRAKINDARSKFENIWNYIWNFFGGVFSRTKKLPCIVKSKVNLKTIEGHIFNGHMKFKNGILYIKGILFNDSEFKKIPYTALKSADLIACLSSLCFTFIPQPIVIYLLYRVIKKDLGEPVLRFLKECYPNHQFIQKLFRINDVSTTVGGDFGVF